MAEEISKKAVRGNMIITISHILNAGKYWVIEPLEEENSKGTHIIKELEEKLTLRLKDSFEIPYNFKANKLIAVKDSKTGTWHRGELTHIPENSIDRVRVFLVDHGSFLFDVSSKDLQILPEEMQDVPQQAFIICLYGLIPLTVDVCLEDINDKMHYEESPFWTPASEIFVQELISDSSSAEFKLVVSAGNIFYGEIFLQMPGEGSLSLNEELVKNNFAYYSEEKYKKVIERDLLLEKKLAQKKIFKRIVDENDEESGIHDVVKLQEKPMLMEDFLKEYASKKSAREKSASSYLNEIRSMDLNSLQKDDLRRKEELKNSILLAPPKPLGRGYSLRNVQESSHMSTHKGRGVPLLVNVEESPAPSSRSHLSTTANSVLGLVDLLKTPEKSKKEADKEMGNSVLSLGRIPAGYPLNFNETPTRKTSKKSDRLNRKTSPLGSKIPQQQSESLVPRRVPMRQNDREDEQFDSTEFQNENLATSYERERLKKNTKTPVNDIYNTHDSQIGTKALGLKSDLENVFPIRRDAEFFLNENSSSVSQQEGNSIEACHTLNRKGILDIIKYYPEHSRGNLSSVASNNRLVNLQKDDLHSESPNLRRESEELSCHNTKEKEIQDEMGCSSQSLLQETKSSSFPEKKILKLMKLQSHSGIPHTKGENTIPHSMSERKESGDKPVQITQGQGTTPLHLLSSIMKRKKKEESCEKVSENVNAPLEEYTDHQPGNYSCRNLQTNSELNVVSEDEYNFENKSLEVSTNMHDGENSAAASNLFSEIIGCQDNIQYNDNNANMTLKQANEEKSSVVYHVETNRNPSVVANDKVNNSVENGEEKDVKVISGHASELNISPPDKIKAAIELFAEAMRELESSNGDNPYVRNLSSLKNELASFKERVIEQSRNTPSLVKDDKQNSSDCRIEPESLIIHSPVAKESFITEKPNVSNEKIISAREVCEKERVMMTTVVETDVSICTDVENFSSRMSSSQNNLNVESEFPSLQSDCRSESSFAETKDSGLNSAPDKDCNHLEGNSRDSLEVTSTKDTKIKDSGICTTKSTETEVQYNVVEVCENFHTGTVEMNKPKENPDLLSVLNPKCDPHSIVNSETGLVLSDRNTILDNSTAQGNHSILNDDFVSKKISSFAKLMSRIEAEEKSKTYNAIKDERVPMSNLSARLPLCALSDLNKSKGSSLSLNSNISSLKKPNIPSDSVDIEAIKIQKQKTLEPELVSPQIPSTDNLPHLLKNSWLSGLGMEDCLFSAHRLKICRILVRGYFLAQRITSIAQATFSKAIHMSLSKMGFRDPMRIQTYAWPALMRGHNLIMVNPPRSGKTLAYLVPIISFMLSSDLYSELPDGNGPLVLILCPSWKGVTQARDFCHCLLSETESHINVVATYGGVEMDQILSLINGCHILISTPKCYIRLLKNDSITTNVERLCHLVLDGADVLMKDFMPEIKEVLRECRLLLQRRARLAAEANPSKETQSYTMVKIVAAAQTWCPQMESFVTNIVEKPLLCIGSYLEAAIYAHLKPVLHLVGFSTSKGEEREEVLNESPRKKRPDIDEVVVGLLKEKVGFYKIVVACDSEVEVKRLAPKVRALGRDVLEVHENLHHFDRAEVLDVWMSSKRSGALPVMIVSDEVLPEISIGDAEHLVHVGIPASSKTQFGLRFSTLMDNYRDIFEKVSTDDTDESKKKCFVDIIVDLTKTDVDISGLIDFLQRLGMTIPPELDAAASKSMFNKEKMKKKNVALCPSLKLFGVCSESVCPYRHVVLADADKPSEGIPTCGEVRVKILNVLSASHMSVRLVEHITPDGIKTSLPSDYYFIASGLDRYFGRVGKKIAHGHPRVGDLCAYEIDANLFLRARVESVIYSCPDIKVPDHVVLSIIDKGIKIKTKANNLLYLPDDLKKYPPQARELIVCKMRPRDLDVSWSKAACIKVAKWLESEVEGEMEGKVIIGKVMLALGNTMWVDPLECQEWLENHKTTVIHLSLRHDLIRAGLAIDNPNHIEALKKLCDIADVQFPSPQPNKNINKKDITETNATCNKLESNPSQLELDKPKSSPVLEWLSSEDLIEVNVSAVDSPSSFRVQKASNSERLKELSKEIQKWISDCWNKSLSKNPDNIKEYTIDSLCLGFLEVDNSWHRAKVISVIKSPLPEEADTSHLGTDNANEVNQRKLFQYKVYFVDYGDIAVVSSNEIVPIPDKFISRLPFQAIECSLWGVSPLEEDSASDSSKNSITEWNQDACDAFYELCREGENLDIFRPLLAKVFGCRETSLYGSIKYLVFLYDISRKCPTRIGDLLAERGFAKSHVSDSEDVNDIELEEKEMEFNWVEEGALVPLTPAFTPAISLYSNGEQLESAVISSEDSNCTALVASKGSLNDSSEYGQFSADDEDSDDYEIVMSDDEVEFYEDRLRRLLGIPPREPANEPREESYSLNSKAIEKFSSPKRFFDDGSNQSSSTSFEDLTSYTQKSCERIEEILEEKGAMLIDPETAVSENEEHKTSVNIDKGKDNNASLRIPDDESGTGDNIQCLQSSEDKIYNIEYFGEKTNFASTEPENESLVLKVDGSTMDCNVPKENETLSSDCGSVFSLLGDSSDIMDEKVSSEIVIKGASEKDRIISSSGNDNPKRALGVEEVRDLGVSIRIEPDENPSNLKSFSAHNVCDKLDNEEIRDYHSLDGVGSCNVNSEQPMDPLLTVPIKSYSDFSNPEEDLETSILEKEDAEDYSDLNKLTEISNKEIPKFLKIVLESQQDISTNIEDVQLKAVEIAMVEENSEQEVQLSEVLSSSMERPFQSDLNDINSTMNDNSDALQSVDSDTKFLIRTSSELTGVSKFGANNESKASAEEINLNVREESENIVILCESDSKDLFNEPALVEGKGNIEVQLSESYSEIPCNSGKCIDEKTDVVQSKTSEASILISSSSEITAEVSNSDLSFISEASREVTDLNATEEGEKNIVLYNVEDEKHNRSEVDECLEVMPELIRAKIPTIKWGQNKREVILMLNLLNMNRYNIHWEKNNKLYIFASSDTDNESRYIVELLLWGPVDVKNCEHMAVSDNVVKLYLRKAFVYKDWPRLLFEPIKPLWLSVDFDMMEFEEEDFSVDVPTRRLVRYSESEDESLSEADIEPYNDVRCEEINYDPYDPLS